MFTGCLGLLRSPFCSSTPALCCQTPSAPPTLLRKNMELRTNFMFFLEHLKRYFSFLSFILPRGVDGNYSPYRSLITGSLGLSSVVHARGSAVSRACSSEGKLTGWAARLWALSGVPSTSLYFLIIQFISLFLTRK